MYHLTDRAQKLRDKMITRPEICIERGYYLTQSFKETEGYPAIIRKAKALENILDHIQIDIEDGELIVGKRTSKTRGGALLPELSSEWIMSELDTLDTRKYDPYAPLSEDEKKELKEYISYWKGKSLKDQIERMVPEELKIYDHTVVSSMGFAENGHYPAHVAIDYGKLLEVGLKGYIEKVKKLQAGLGTGEPDEVNKALMYQAVLICYDAVIRLAHRYADLALTKAKGAEVDENHKAELIEIARICNKVPYEPAETFHEALQSCWFLYICMMLEGWGAGMSLGRADQYLLPFYRKDIADGILTEDKARELISLVFIKMNDVFNPQDAMVACMMTGSPTMQGMTIGGCKVDGTDAVNELSYLILDAEEGVGLTNEDIVVRVNKENPNAFIERACEVARNLNGKLKFVSDKTTIAQLMSTGIPEEYANNYISTGCHNPTIPNITHDIGGSSMNYAMILELLLNHGVCKATGVKYGVDLGNPEDYKTYEDFAKAFEEEFEYVTKRLFFFKHCDLQLYEQLPVPLLSSFYEGCLEKGLDIQQFGVYMTTHSTAIVGAANVGDSMAAIKKTIYDDKSLTWERLLKLLDNNMEGDDEAVYLLKKVPKYGNNEPYVDTILHDVLAASCDWLNTQYSYKGVKTTPAALAMTINLPFGSILGASPDGRKAGDPLSEGGISPMQGRNVTGITSTMASVAALDQVKLSHGSILNIRVSKKAVASEENLKKFAAALRTFCMIGGDLVQFNFVDEETLRDAQVHPEKYKDLLVRVATYSAYYVELSKELQDDIISRFEFEYVG